MCALQLHPLRTACMAFLNMQGSAGPRASWMLLMSTWMSSTLTFTGTEGAFSLLESWQRPGRPGSDGPLAELPPHPRCAAKNATMEGMCWLLKETVGEVSDEEVLEVVDWMEEEEEELVEGGPAAPLASTGRSSGRPGVLGSVGALEAMVSMDTAESMCGGCFGTTSGAGAAAVKAAKGDGMEGARVVVATGGARPTAASANGEAMDGCRAMAALPPMLASNGDATGPGPSAPSPCAASVTADGAR